MRLRREVDHPFLVKLHYAFATPDKLYLIVDFVQGGELYYHLRNKKSFSVAETQFFLAELALALGKLHELDIIYRDLKPENVLVDHDGHIKLTDFGLAKKDVSEENRPTTFCGTPLYLAPESIKVRAEHTCRLVARRFAETCSRVAGQSLPQFGGKTGYGMEIDWWTFGALMFEMLTGDPPFTAGSIKELLRVILEADVATDRISSAEARDAIVQLLQKDPSR